MEFVNFIRNLDINILMHSRNYGESRQYNDIGMFFNTYFTY